MKWLKTYEKWRLRLPAHLCSFREGQLPSQSFQAVERVLHARQGKLVTMFLQIPITEPADGGQVLRFPVGVIAIEVIDGQNMAAYFEAFGPPAILTAIASTDFGKPGHFLTVVQPFSLAVSGLEITV
jgi:hypothetical protein